MFSKPGMSIYHIGHPKAINCDFLKFVMTARWFPELVRRSDCSPPCPTFRIWSDVC